MPTVPTGDFDYVAQAKAQQALERSHPNYHSRDWVRFHACSLTQRMEADLRAHMALWPEQRKLHEVEALRAGVTKLCNILNYFTVGGESDAKYKSQCKRAFKLLEHTTKIYEQTCKHQGVTP